MIQTGIFNNIEKESQKLEGKEYLIYKISSTLALNLEEQEEQNISIRVSFPHLFFDISNNI